MPVPKSDPLQGTLDMLILQTLAAGAQHGYGVSVRIQQMSDGVLKVTQGSLYPALHRLERDGWIQAAWGDSENNRRARFYTLTRAGRKRLEKETANWQRLSEAIARVLKPA